MGGPLAIGTITGRRGTAGEVTVRVGSGLAERWTQLRSAIVETTDGDTRAFEVEAVRAYRGRLVVKLRGIDDAGQAARLRGGRLLAPEDQVPVLPEGQYWIARLVGMDVREESDRVLGRVLDVVEAGGGHLLRVGPQVDSEGDEILVPLVREIVVEVDEDQGRVRVRLPEGLLELNRRSG